MEKQLEQRRAVDVPRVGQRVGAHGREHLARRRQQVGGDPLEQLAVEALALQPAEGVVGERALVGRGHVGALERVLGPVGHQRVVEVAVDAVDVAPHLGADLQEGGDTAEDAARHEPQLVGQLGAAGGRHEPHPVPQSGDGSGTVGAKDGVLALPDPLEGIFSPLDVEPQAAHPSRAQRAAVRLRRVDEIHLGEADGAVEAVGVGHQRPELLRRRAQVPRPAEVLLRLLAPRFVGLPPRARRAGRALRRLEHLVDRAALGHRLEPLDQGAPVGEALGGLLRQAAVDEGGDRLRDRPASVADGYRVGVAHVAHQLLGADADVRPLPAGEHLVQKDAHPVHVGGGSDGLVQGLLRRHVRRRPEDAGEAAKPGARVVGDAEIEDPRVTAHVDEHVARLEVAVDDAALVGDRQRAGHVEGDLHRATDREGTLVDDRRQLRAGDQVHRVVGLPVEGEAHVVDPYDPRVDDLRREEGFDPQLVVLSVELRLVNLERHVAVEAQLDGFVDRAHASGSEQLEDLVAGDLRRLVAGDNVRRRDGYLGGNRADHVVARDQRGSGGIATSAHFARNRSRSSSPKTLARRGVTAIVPPPTRAHTHTCADGFVSSRL